MILSEVFGPTIQGEGASAGEPCGFVRFGRCNLNCVWCDTSYTWDWEGQNGTAFDPAEELTESSLREVLDKIKRMDVPMVVVTGGEPLIQRAALTSLCRALKDLELRVEIETNGTLAVWPELSESVDQFNVGIKLANSGVPKERRIVAKALKSFVESERSNSKVTFKFVVCQVEELAEVASVQARFGLADSQIWVMPEGVSAAALCEAAQLLRPHVESRKWHLTNREHVLKWGDKRGV